jgi:hypothetical protein
MLPTLQLEEPVVLAAVGLLEANLPGVISEMNATIDDGYTLDSVKQFLPFLPIPTVLQGGMPTVGVGEIQGRFYDDLQTSINMAHRFVVLLVVQNADHETLVWQLRRLASCAINVMQADRLQGPAQQGGLFSVNFIGTDPGPVLADVDPINGDLPPRSYMSWTGLIFEGTRAEV